MHVCALVCHPLQKSGCYRVIGQPADDLLEMPAAQQVATPAPGKTPAAQNLYPTDAPAMASFSFVDSKKTLPNGRTYQCSLTEMAAPNPARRRPALWIAACRDISGSPCASFRPQDQHRRRGVPARPCPGSSSPSWRDPAKWPGVPRPRTPSAPVVVVHKEPVTTTASGTGLTTRHNVGGRSSSCTSRTGQSRSCRQSGCSAQESEGRKPSQVAVAVPYGEPPG